MPPSDKNNEGKKWRQGCVLVFAVLLAHLIMRGC